MLQAIINKLPTFVKRHTIPILIVWTFLVVILVLWSFYNIQNETLEKARIQARTIWDHNLIYRKWVTYMGGVYVRRDKMPPNPYLKVPDRDKTTTDGIELTMANPAYMTRQVFEIIQKETKPPIVNRIVSDQYLNPDNRPDEWEMKGFKAFEKGIKEVSEVTDISGVPYMRLFKPMITEEGCLKCHGHQGYKVGDIRGGISVAIPMKPYYEGMAREQRDTLFAYLFLWTAGVVIISFFSRNIQKEQQRIEDSERKLRNLFESAADWEYWISEDRKIMLMSPSCEDITGYRPEEFSVNQNLITNIVHKDDRPIYEKHMTDEFTAPGHESIEFRIVTKNGAIKWLSHVCGPIYLGAGFLGRRVVNRDITDRKRLEEQLLQAQKMDAVGQLAGGIAHDFNNILTAIIGYSSLMRIKMKEDDPLRTYLEQILSSAERAASMTQGLLAFGRKQIINPVTVNLNDIVKKVERFLTRLIGEDIELKTILSDVELNIMADPVQIEQVLINLATNARDAMPDGGVFTIETRPMRIDEEYVRRHAFTVPGMYALLSVTDTGLGMDEKTKERIFEPFFTTKEVGKGTGLGLSIVYGIIKQNNGNINVYSEPGKGTTFKIYLPLVRKETVIEQTEVLPPIKGGTETILVAEDEADVRRLVKEVMEKYGYRVIEALDGEDAIKRFSENKDDIHLALLDVVMPKRSGKEVYEAIKEMKPDVKIMFMSGYTNDIIHKKGILEVGMDFIQKPLSPDELLRKVREILDR
jgi:PAS domain S-box-containing protein